MARARAFTLDITKPSGRVPQIGDNDSGRFVKLVPVASPRAAGDTWPTHANPEQLQAGGAADVDWVEDHLDHTHLVDAIDGLLGISEPDGLGVDGAIIRALAKPPSAWAETGAGDADRVRLGDLRDAGCVRAIAWGAWPHRAVGR